MTINKIPKYRYSLFDKWDKDTFELIKETAATKNYPQITGSKEDKNQSLYGIFQSKNLDISIY